MLNITENKIAIDINDFKSFEILKRSKRRKIKRYFGFTGMALLILFSFLPWTQSIIAHGNVSTRSPEQRPQAVQSIIDGRIEKWFVLEGDQVNKGDTIVYVSEVKSEYFDPNLLDRTQEQIDAKVDAVASYEEKVSALETQGQALKDALELKKQQVQNKIIQTINKVKIDSIDLEAFKVSAQLAENQLMRTNELYTKGLKTLTEVQEKELKSQSANAKYNAQVNKLENQQNVVYNLKLELLAIEKEYSDKISKSKSEQQSAIASMLESKVEISKLKNKLSNYTERQKNYFITAPQSGYINKILKKGIGETVKKGVDIATIMPDEYDLAVQVIVKPQDLPLLNIGNKANIRFDGWPAIAISGWPESSVGVYSGNIVAIDQFISKDGYYSVLITPDESDRDWPDKLRVGTGVKTFVLLNNVPIWYETWRKLNGFPADFYAPKSKKEKVKLKTPLKKVK